MAYRRLLDTYYTTEKPLPSDIRQVCRLVLATTESQREAVEIVLGEFFQLTEFGWVNSRADVEISVMREKQQKQRDRVNKRWDKVRNERGTASDAQETITGNATEQETDTAVQKTLTNVIPPTPTPTPTPIAIPLAAKAAGSAKRRAQQLPDDFMPNSDGMERAAVKGVDAMAELEKFRNHHLAKASLMSDWQAAWRTWIGNARQTTAPRSAAKVGSDEYFEIHRRAQWVKDAGFETVWEAANACCWHHNFHEFRDGKRIPKAA